MRIIQIPTLGRSGRFGNWLLLYSYARKRAERHDAILQTPDWPGRKIFDLHDPLIEERVGDQFWFQCDKVYDPNYTIEDFRRYLPFKTFLFPENHVPKLAVHMRRGDFTGSPLWPNVAQETIGNGILDAKLKLEDVEFFTEEEPHRTKLFQPQDTYLWDFVLMAHAETLFVYPSSSFSGCAGMLNTNAVYLPHDYTNGPTDCHWKLRA